MKFFGSLLFFLFSFGLFAKSKVYLTKDQVLRGEPFFLQIELNGDGEVETDKNIYSKEGVTLEYIGQEESINSTNFKVTRKKILKFRVLTTKTGNLETPSISYKLDGKEETVSPLKFTVKNEKYVAKANPFDNNIFDNFFNRDNFSDLANRNIEAPVPEDFIVQFFPLRKTIYVGESVLASFILYYKNVTNPNFNRIDQKAIEFPYFMTEILPNKLILKDQTEVLNGQTFSLLPYNSELYIITALRKGSYSLGESNFIIESGPFGMFQPIQKKAVKKTILVKELPSPKPANFSEQVGKYKFIIESNIVSVPLGEPIHFKLKVIGEGGLGNWKDPLQNYCIENECKGRIVFLNEEKTKTVDKLSNGEYGYKTETVFHYSYYPSMEGKIKLPLFKKNFFNPYTDTYEEVDISFPEYTVLAKLQIEKEVLPSSFSLYWKEYFLYTLVSLFSLFAIYLLRKEILKSIQNLFKKKSLFKWIPIEFKIPSEILEIDELIGNKKGTLLRVFLKNKGFDKLKIEELVELKSKTNETLEEIYKKSNFEQKEKILFLVKELNRRKI
jgi:hypothetical protein